MRHIWKFLLIVAGIFVAAQFITIRKPRFTCLLCRAYRVDTICLGITVTSTTESDCSRWYTAHVEPRHNHMWEISVCVYESNLFGQPLRVGCSPGRFPIWRLDPDVQLGVYQHFKNPIEAKDIFAGLSDAKTGAESDLYELHSKEDLIISAATGWAEAGFPGTWDTYWNRMYATHAEENKEYRDWMKSDNHMNFGDWKARKNQPPEHP